MAVKTIENRDLAQIQENAGLFSVGSARNDFLKSAREILVGNEDYSSEGLLIIASFRGLQELGFSPEEQLILMKKGLKALGVSVPTE